jgi:hypothetical protein
MQPYIYIYIYIYLYIYFLVYIYIYNAFMENDTGASSGLGEDFWGRLGPFGTSDVLLGAPRGSHK